MSRWALALGLGVGLGCAEQGQVWLAPPWDDEEVGFLMAQSVEGRPLQMEPIFLDGRAPIAFVHTMEDLLTSPQLEARGFIQRIDHPVAGEASYPGPPWWIGPDGWSHLRAPLLGEHTTQVLGSSAS